jgi:hypothetical protein
VISLRRLGVFAVLSLAACSSHTAAPQQSSPTPSESSPSPEPVATTTAPSAPPSTAPASAAPTAAATPVCTAAQLRLTTVNADSGAGQFHQRIVLTNRAAACTLQGYPGVSFVDAQGNTLGSPAAKSGGAVRRVLLDPGGTAVAVLTYANAGAFPDSTCRPTTADRLRVYPPGSTVALLVKDPVLVCAASGSDQLHIGPIEVSS